MKAGGITPSDLRDVGFSLMFVHRMDEFLDSSAQAVVKLEVFSAYVDYTVQCRRTEMNATGLYRKAVNSPSCRLQYGRLPYVALAFLGRQASNAASEGCHSTGQLVMSDKQTTMSNDTLEKIVCLRNSRTAVTVLKKIYVDEAKHVAHDISARLSHWQVPTSATSNLAQSREADDSCMFPLSDPE
jgi:hypothetical protein